MLQWLFLGLPSHFFQKAATLAADTRVGSACVMAVASALLSWSRKQSHSCPSGLHAGPVQHQIVSVDFAQTNVPSKASAHESTGTKLQRLTHPTESSTRKQSVFSPPNVSGKISISLRHPFGPKSNRIRYLQRSHTKYQPVMAATNGRQQTMTQDEQVEKLWHHPKNGLFYRPP